MTTLSFRPLLSGVALAALLAGCSSVRTQDSVAVGPIAADVPVIEARSLGRVLLVPIVSASPAGPVASADTVREALSTLPPGSIMTPESLLGPTPAGGWATVDEGRLLAAARGAGLSSVMIVRVDDYVRRGTLSVAVAVPPVSWDTKTAVGVHLRVLDAATGAVRADVRRVRENGGLYTLRTADDLPQELNAAVASLVTGP